MAARLPTVGGDDGNWGSVLNNFLQVAHNSDGSLKNLYFNVKDYGAVGDGVTDDSAAIQAAINAAGEHDTVFFPKPTTSYNYIALTVKNHLRLMGPYGVDESNRAVLKCTGGAGYSITSNLPASNMLSVVFENLVFDGVNNTPSGIQLASQRLVVRNCSFRRFSVALNVTTANDNVIENRIENCFFLANGTAILNNAGASGANTDGFVTNCIFQDQTSKVWDYATTHGWFFSGNHFYHATPPSNPISLSGYLFRLTGNFFEAADTQVAITITSNGAGIVIAGNHFMNTNAGGVALSLTATQDCDGVEVYGNTFIRYLTPSATAIQVNDSTYKVLGNIHDNVFYQYSTNFSSTQPGNVRYMEFSNQLASFTASQLKMMLGDKNILMGYCYGDPATDDAIGSLKIPYAGASVTQAWLKVAGGTGGWMRIPRFNKAHVDGATAPTTGTWAVGDVCWNTAPSAGGPPGWVCVVAGTPGTWKAMANLAA